MAGAPLSHSHLLTSGGFEKLKFRAQTDSHQKIRLYHLNDATIKKTERAKEAILQEQKAKHRTYSGKLEVFAIEIQNKPYLMKEGNRLKLISQETVSQIQEVYRSFKKEKNNNAQDLLRKGIQAEEMANYSEALIFFEKSLQVAEKKKDITLILSAIEHIGGIFLIRGNHTLALKIYACALKISQDSFPQKDIFPFLEKMREVERDFLALNRSFSSPVSKENPL